MEDYKKLVEKALNNKKKVINEGFKYSPDHRERMHPKIEKDILEGNHSLGKHPAIPTGNENNFIEGIMSERFNDVVKTYKRAHDVENINNQDVIRNMMPLVMDSMKLEAKHIKELEALAVKMIRDEYDMGEDTVEIIAELTPDIDMSGTKETEEDDDMEFDSHDHMENANDEVYKRRFLNTMTQGAAKKCNHMFHMVEDELSDMNPLLPAKYSKMMSSADYMYYIIPDMAKQGSGEEPSGSVNGGVVRVEFPTAENPKAIIHAQAMVFPVLIHELVKGVMEILSAHGLPEDEKMGNYVISKADSLNLESNDLRMGPALWTRFTEMIDPNDFNLKHHIYAEMAALPVKEFNQKMREVMAGTKAGKQIITDMVKEIKTDLKKDDYRIAMMDEEKNSYLDSDDLDNIDLGDLLN